MLVECREKLFGEFLGDAVDEARADLRQFAAMMKGRTAKVAAVEGKKAEKGVSSSTTNEEPPPPTDGDEVPF